MKLPTSTSKTVSEREIRYLKKTNGNTPSFAPELGEQAACRAFRKKTIGWPLPRFF